MKFSLAALVALVGCVAAQEAARYGAVSVSPETVKAGETFSVHFNNTLGRFAPKYLDIYLQGTFTASSRPLSYVLLQRSNYPSGAENVYFDGLTLPDDPVFTFNGTSFLLWAFITYPVSNATNPGLEVGGTSALINIEQSE